MVIFLEIKIAKFWPFHLCQEIFKEIAPKTLTFYKCNFLLVVARNYRFLLFFFRRAFPLRGTLPCVPCAFRYEYPIRFLMNSQWVLSHDSLRLLSYLSCVLRRVLSVRYLWPFPHALLDALNRQRCSFRVSVPRAFPYSSCHAFKMHCHPALLCILGANLLCSPIVPSGFPLAVFFPCAFHHTHPTLFPHGIRGTPCSLEQTFCPA